MVVTEDALAEKIGAGESTGEKIGKVEFTIGFSDSRPNLRTARESRVEALAEWLFVTWQLQNREGN